MPAVEIFKCGGYRGYSRAEFQGSPLRGSTSGDEENVAS